jgi:hypothetical protein
VIAACIDDLNTASCVFSIFGVIISAGALIYSITVNRRVLKIERLHSMQLLQPLLDTLVDFQSRLSEQDQEWIFFKTPVSIGTEPLFKITMQMVEDFFAEQDLQLLERTRWAMFDINSNLSNTQGRPDNQFKGKDREKCYLEFSKMLWECTNIRPRKFLFARIGLGDRSKL